MEKPELLVTLSDEVALEAFVVAQVLRTPPDKKYGPKDIKELFWGECSQADALFAWGIIRNLVAHKKQAMLIFNPEQEIPDFLCKDEGDDDD